MNRSQCIGVDFDNTIVCHDDLFYQAALEQGLIPPTLPPGKSSVRDYLRAIDNEQAWTQLQGYVYGPGMTTAPAFPGVLSSFRRLVHEGVNVYIISHRTPYPYLGPRYDLHQAAREWLDRNGFFDPSKIGLRQECVFLEAHKQEKLKRIALLGCTHFIDDLPELLSDPTFPAGVERILFDPHDDHPTAGYRRIRSWNTFELQQRAAG